MYGLESKSSKEPFAFDLELEIRANPKRKEEILKKTESSLQEIKQALRAGTANEEELDKFGILLEGFTALQKVIQKTK